MPSPRHFLCASATSRARHATRCIGQPDHRPAHCHMPPVANAANIIARALAATAATSGFAPARADVENQIMAEKFYIIGNQGVDTEQLTAYLGQAHGVLLGLLLACKTTEQPKPHAFSSPEGVLNTKNQTLSAFLDPPQVQ